MTSLNTVDFLASNEIYPSLISFCNEIELNRDKVAKVIAVIASDHFKNMDSCNLKKVLEKIIWGNNPEVAQVSIISDNFDVKKIMEEGVKDGDSKIATIAISSDNFKNMNPSHLQEVLIEVIKIGDLEAVRAIIIASNHLKGVCFSHLKRTLIEAIKNGNVELVKAVMASHGFKNIYNLKKALIEAMKGGHVEIAKAIITFDYFKNVSLFTLKRIFRELSKDNHLEIAEAIIKVSSDFKNIHPSDLQEVLAEFNNR